MFFFSISQIFYATLALFIDVVVMFGEIYADIYGITLFEAAEAELVPILFVAVTVNV